MIPERMLELIYLTYFYNREYERAINNPYYPLEYDMEKLKNRIDELEHDLLKPYVIDNTEKSV